MKSRSPTAECRPSRNSPGSAPVGGRCGAVPDIGRARDPPYRTDDRLSAASSSALPTRIAPSAHGRRPKRPAVVPVRRSQSQLGAMKAVHRLRTAVAGVPFLEFQIRRRGSPRWDDAHPIPGHGSHTTAPGPADQPQEVELVRALAERPPRRPAGCPAPRRSEGGRAVGAIQLWSIGSLPNIAAPDDLPDLADGGSKLCECPTTSCTPWRAAARSWHRRPSGSAPSASRHDVFWVLQRHQGMFGVVLGRSSHVDGIHVRALAQLLDAPERFRPENQPRISPAAPGRYRRPP